MWHMIVWVYIKHDRQQLVLLRCFFSVFFPKKRACDATRFFPDAFTSSRIGQFVEGALHQMVDYHLLSIFTRIAAIHRFRSLGAFFRVGAIRIPHLPTFANVDSFGGLPGRTHFKIDLALGVSMIGGWL